MPIPEFRTFIYPTLEVLGNDKVYTRKNLVKEVINNFNFTEDELKETTRMGTKTKIEDRIEWSVVYLYNTPLIERLEWGKYKITEEGHRILKDSSITELNEEFLMQYSDFRKFKNKDRGIGDSVGEGLNYWIYSPGSNAHKWKKFYEKGIMCLGSSIGDLKQYKNKSEISNRLLENNIPDPDYTNDKLALWNFVNVLKEGDIIFVKKGIGEIIGYGIIESEYIYDETLDEKCHNIRNVKWIKKCNEKINQKLSKKILTCITDKTDLIDEIKESLGIQDIESETEFEEYSKDDFLNEAYIDEDSYYKLVDLLKYKKNIILQGAPGVGKTFISKRLAYSLIGYKDKTKVAMVQFHQSYSYEDFIMGYRPSNEGFELRAGIFYNFCKKAQEDEDNNYYFIIDEINRGNLSKIFGELFMLIEEDKRGVRNKIQLLYNDENFYIPENVYIIGMMNTADRSLAMLDYALRRRFSFFNLEPAFNSNNFIQYMNQLDNITFNNLISTIKELNEDIRNDETLGKGFMIGHSYFTKLESESLDEKLYYIINYEIIPLLEEYWFDEENKLKMWSNTIRRVIE